MKTNAFYGKESLCLECGNRFKPSRNHPNTKWCSQKCRVQAYQHSKGIGILKEKSCVVCGVIFKTKYNKKILCSIKCKKEKWDIDNPGRRKLLNKNWNINNKDRKNYLYSKWRKDNPKAYNKINKRYKYNRKKRDIEFKILCYLRTRLYKAVKNNNKSKTTIELIGCTMDYLKQHIENKFKEGMDWDNYGKWHMDHIKPCASFDLSKEEEQKKCFNYRSRTL